ncbi:MAG: MFS transporter [Pseudomonadota bacterium]
MPRLAAPPALTMTLAGLHAADQIASAALPLIATLTLGAGPGAVGALVAAQGAAWLLVALPAGVLVDRAPRAAVLRGAATAAALLCLLAMAAPGAGWLALAAFLAASAVVPGVLAAFSIVPLLVPREGLARANAALELARAAATLAAPPLAGFCAARGRPDAALALAAAAGVLAFIAAQRLPSVLPASQTDRPGIAAAIIEGARFVRGEPHLAAIALVAIGWNSAFFALQAVLVPLALGPLGLSPAATGLALGAYGAGLVIAALVAPWIGARASPGFSLMAGPLLSVAAIMAILAAPLGAAALWLALGQFLLGFGPMLWQIAQTSLRQSVTPPGLLGRVGATMQVAVFGVRPLGALAGGALAAWQGPQAAVWLAAIGFAASLVVLMGSVLPRLRVLPGPRPAR